VAQSPRGRGRPASRWQLTSRADALFPDRHTDLSVSLIRGLRASLGEVGLNQVLQARDGELIQTYRALLDPLEPTDILRRADALAGIRTDEGYMAEARTDGETEVLLIENHCPICEGARACTALCRSELEVFRTVLGGDVSVEREQHLLAGDRRCVYRIRPHLSLAPAPRRPPRHKERGSGSTAVL
jgi:predicted ArsR family transcriptional regulator